MTNEMIEIEYNRARKLIDKNTLESLTEARNILIELDDYKESKKYLADVITKINSLECDLEEEKEEKYNRALDLLNNKPTTHKVDQAIKLLKELNDYKDSESILDSAINKRKKLMDKDKKNLDKFTLLGYIFAGIGVGIVVLIIGGVIFAVLS